ncbi:MAG TPA: DinB family protein [Candidatus Limnocylindrales bacterium]
MTTPERAALLDRLRAGPQRVAAAALAAQARRLAAGGGRHAGWSEREIVDHLIRVERDVFQSRLWQVAREDEPHWQWVEPGAEPGHAALATLAGRFERVRARTIDHLARLDERGWARSGVHATYGRLDVAALLGVAVEHDTDHLAELARRA